MSQEIHTTISTVSRLERVLPDVTAPPQKLESFPGSKSLCHELSFIRMYVCECLVPLLLKGPPKNPLIQLYTTTTLDITSIFDKVHNRAEEKRKEKEEKML